MSEQSLELLNRIRGRVQSAARRMTLAEVLFGFVLTIGIVSGIWALSAGIEAGFWLDTGVRTGLFWTVIVLCGSLFTYFIIVPVLRLLGVLPGPSVRNTALHISDRFPQLGDRLINLLDLSEGRRSDAPDELVDGAVQMLGREVDPLPLEEAEDFGRARRAVRLAAFPILAALVFVTAAPSTFFDASRRILSPGVDFEQPAPFRLFVEPGSTELARGSSMAIQVRSEGHALPKSLVLSINNLDEEHVEQVRLSPDSGNVFRHEIANVRRSFRYRVQAAPVSSPWYTTQVTEHPVVRNLQVTLQYPSYAGIPAQQLDPNVGDFSGLPGTRAQLEVALGGSQPANAHIQFEEDERTEPLEIEGGVARGSFTVTKPDRYRVVLENEQGVRNRDPISYSINVVSDASPSIVLVSPEPDAVLNEDLQQRLEARINDDYGFHDLTLFYRLAESRFGETSESFSHLAMPIESPRSLDQDVLFDWAVAERTDLDPVPGDVIEYYVRVRDNDTYAGFKSAETSIQRLRLPSLAEQYESLSREQDEVESEMEDAASQARQLDEQFQQLRDEIRRKQEADWEDERQIEQIRQQQEQLEQRVDDLSQQVESMNESARQNNLLSDETLEMYEEMQKVVEEINSPELRDALQQLQEAVEQLNLSEMQEAIEDFEFNEQQYQERLERALELFKNLRTQQALEEAARRADELAKQQERLAEETADLMDEAPEEESEDESGDRNAEGTNSEEQDAEGDQSDESKSGEGEPRGSDTERDADNHPTDGQDSESGEDGPAQEQESEAGEQRNTSTEQLAREQELSRQEMQQLEELLEDLQRQVEELNRGPKEEMNRLNESVRQQQLPQEMQRNAEQLRKNQLQDAQSGQQQMQQQLQQMQSQLSQMQSNMQGSQMQINLAGLRRSLSDILTLSKQQEDLRQGLRNNVSEAPSLRADTRRQVELSEGLTTVVDSLQKLSANIPQMSREVQRQAGQALREMGQATESMTERSVGQAAGHQKASMMHLNELALLLSEVMNQMMNASGSGSGNSSLQQMIQQMQQTAQQQQQLNKQIQQFLNEMQGNRLGVDAQQRLQQMAAQQQAIKKQLDEIRRNPEARGNLLGDLQKIGDQMEETIGELEQRHLNPQMVERQQQILQRLLDAQRSIHQRGKDDKREAREGDDFSRESPDALPPEEAAEKLRRDLIRALESGYAPDYEELIKRYFELLQQQR